MKVLVTGATGFVGRWLTAELAAAGHEVVATPPRTELDIQDVRGIASLLRSTLPDAVVHLAGLSFAPDALRDRQQAVSTNIGGTQSLFTALAAAGSRAPVLVSGSADVYGSPDPADLPLREDAPLLAEHPYGLSKLGQETTAVAGAARARSPLVVTRSFNHTGPGQRSEFVAPALARRVLDARLTGDRRIRTGNLGARRDFTDVRDVVRAYRLLLEWLVAGRPPEPLVVNVASGRSVSVGELLGLIGAAAGVEPEAVVDPALVRKGDPPEIVGDASRLHALTGWSPEIPLERTIADLVGSLDDSPSRAPAGVSRPNASPD